MGRSKLLTQILIIIWLNFLSTTVSKVASSTNLNKVDGDGDDERGKGSNGKPYRKKVRDLEPLNKIPTYRIPSPNDQEASELIHTAKGMMLFAGASYCSTESLQSWRCSYCRNLNTTKANSQLQRILDSDEDNTRALIFEHHTLKQIVLSFRGSENFLKVIRIGSTKRIKLFDDMEVKVHRVTKELLDGIISKILPELKRFIQARPGWHVVLTGHSLGGSLATLTAPILHRQLNVPYPNMSVITYGQPRVGDVAFARWYNQLPLHAFLRVVNSKDVVTHHPKESSDWQHVHREIFIKDGQTRVCSIASPEDTSCAYDEFIWNPFSFTDNHQNYWGELITGDTC